MPEENTWYIKLVKPNFEAVCIENENLTSFLIDVITFMRTYYTWDELLTIPDYEDYKTELELKRALYESLKFAFRCYILTSGAHDGIYSKVSEDYILAFLSPSDE